MNIAHMSQSMRKDKQIVFFTTNRCGFFVQRQSRIAAIHVPFDLAQTFERSDQLASRSGLTAKCYGRGVVAMRVVESILQPRAIRFDHQFQRLLGIARP